MSIGTNYIAVTEIAGDEVTQEQVARLCNRYYWSGQYCRDKDVVEAACGTGQGLGYLASVSQTIEAGDYSQDIVDIALSHYGNRISIKQFDAQDMPFSNQSKDVIILFEAIYYLPDASKFVSECRRVLRPGGRVLVSTANPDLFDFNPSPYSYVYYGTAGLSELFESKGFQVNCFGDTPLEAVSLRQRVLRPVKKIVVMLNLMPKSMAGKKILKRLVFGSLVTMPVEITPEMFTYVPPVSIPRHKPDTCHKVIYCEAIKV